VFARLALDTQLAENRRLTELLIGQGLLSCLTGTWLDRHSRYKWIQPIQVLSEWGK
jgi:hypothetical protein